jgi:AraC family transcriptional regulator
VATEVEHHTSTHLSAVLPALLQMHVNLSGDLRTETLARTAHMSRARFHTVFADTVGETVKQHTLRLRLERAAFRLLCETTDIAGIAFDLGFGSHEAFSRQFRRRFHQSPTEYRAKPPPANPPDLLRQPGLEDTTGDLYLSGTTPVHLAATPIVFRRYTGPYEMVRPDAFEQLVQWAREHDVACSGLLGIAHDAPGITAPDRLRFDVCARVAGDVTGDPTTAYRVLPQRWASSTWYSGPAHRLGEAVASAYRASHLLAGFTVTGLPLEEHYTSSQILTADRIETLRILIPLVPRGPSA